VKKEGECCPGQREEGGDRAKNQGKLKHQVPTGRIARRKENNRGELRRR